MIRVPLLLQKSVAVVHRLDIVATQNTDPTGEETAGYDHTLREAIVYNKSAIEGRVSSRKEMNAVRIPCQVENMTEEMLREMLAGDDSISNFILVLHRKTLETMGLLDDNREVVIKKGDRVSAIERFGAAPGTIVKKFSDPGLYVHEVRGRSWGFGPDGYDLELLILSRRRAGATA
jgi:hypothetical protein